MNMSAAIEKEIHQHLRADLEVDRGLGDITTNSLQVTYGMKGNFIAKAEGVLAGMDACVSFVKKYYPEVTLETSHCDGAMVAKGECIATISGAASTLLTLERTLLNMMQHLSGIATQTYLLTKAIEGSDATVVDTRKTLPGMRMIQKYAVTCGGGSNHRVGLYDMVLIKDNHLESIRQTHANDYIAEAVKRSRSHIPSDIEIMIEVESIDQMLQAAEAGADYIMLDNMDVPTMSKAVRLLKDRFGDMRPKLEGSGNITLETIRPVAETGVDRISVGSITHSVTALDISLKFQPLQ